MDILQLVLRIVHIVAAVALGGALVYRVVALRPALRTLDEGPRLALDAQLAQRWIGTVFAGAGLLLASGLLTFLLFRVPEYRGRPSAAAYHGLFGLKLLAGLLLLHAAAVLSLPGPRFASYRAGRFWPGYALALLVVVLVLGALLRYLPAIYSLVRP